MIPLALDIVDMTVVRDRTVAVDRASLAVARGTWFGLIGANGSGKTSLLRAIAGRLRCEVGASRIDGVELGRDPVRRAALIGFMPPAELLPGALTCRQLFGLVQPDETTWRAGVAAIWDAAGLERLIDRRIGDCSAGMRQRVALGCAFATGNAVVILDEPFNWLDPVAAYDLRAALRAAVGNGLTLITALHDMVTLLACDAGMLLGEGRVVTQLDEQALRNGRNSPTDFESGMITILRQHSQFT